MPFGLKLVVVHRIARCSRLPRERRVNRRTFRAPPSMGCAVIAACFAIAALAAPGYADDWPRWRGPHGTGITDESGWLDRWPDAGPTIAWNAEVGTGFSSVVVAEGRAYTMGNADETDTVWCLDASTGATLWKHGYDAPLDPNLFEGGPTATPTIAGDRVYTSSRWGDVFCFDAATGEVAWTVNVHESAGVRVPGWGFAGSPVVYGDLLLLNAGDSGVALEAATGHVAWKSLDKDCGYSTPVLLERDDAVQALLASSDSIVAVDAATGNEIWRYRWLTRFGLNAADPIVAGDRVFISSGYGKGCTLVDVSQDPPAEIWRTRELRNQFNSSVLIDGYLYGIDGDTTSDTALKCVELESGETQWSKEGFGSGSLIAAAGRLIVLGDGGELVVAPVSPEGFVPTAGANVLDDKCWTAPTLAGGRIYCRSAEGEIVCVDVRAPSGR